jgi:hypothetical protein
MSSRNQYNTCRFKDNLQWCNYCKQYLTYASFYTYKESSSYYCKECSKISSRKNHNERIKVDPEYKRSKRNDSIKRTHGITLQQYEEKLATQKFECAICRVKLPAQGSFTHLDHDHKTGKLRDFLCTNCNRGLGHFQDSSTLLMNAQRYLNTHNSNVDTIKEVHINESSH